MLKVLPGQRPSFTAMEDIAPRERVLHMATGLDVRTNSCSLNVLQVV